MFILPIDDEVELNVLHMLIIEAKFSKQIERVELRTSPYTCRLAKKVLTEFNKKQTKIKTDIEIYPELVAKIPSMIEEVVPDTWNTWNRDFRKKFFELLICPFHASSDFIDKYIDIELSYDINDYPEKLEQIIANIKYEVEVNDPKYWKELLPY